MSANLQRAMILMQQSRLDLAERELRTAVVENPEDGLPHALLSMCLTDLNRHSEATDEAHEAIRLAPDLDLAHYALAHVLVERRRPVEAEAAIQEALRLDPGDADYHALLARILIDRRRWAEALEAADRGLSFDAEHVGCNNLRAVALVQLGRREEAGRTIGSALERDPEDPLSHANLGWTLLHEGKPNEAMPHFRETLRLDPNQEWARAGIVEAMKARNPIYRLMLGYALWMGRLGRQAQWLVLLALIFGRRILSGIAADQPQWAPLINVAILALFGFVVLTWIAYPLFNLLLMTSKFGRLALSGEQRTGAYWLGTYLLALAVSAALGFALGDGRWLVLAVDFGLLLLPVGGTFQCPVGWPRTVMMAVTLLLTLLGPGSLLLAQFVPPESVLFERTRLWHGHFVTGAMLSTWLGMFLSQAQVRR